MPYADGATRSAVLLVYNRPGWRRYRDAATIVEQVDAFERYSRFAVYALNTDLGTPPGIEDVGVGAVVLHYSLFGVHPYRLDERFLAWLRRSGAYKICFFSDEHAWCRTRRAFIDEHRIDCVFSHVDPRYAQVVYGRCAHPPRVEFNLPGYVTEEVRSAAVRLARLDEQRPIDVGYRGRALPPWMGRGVAEKVAIADGFARRAEGRGLTLDIDTREDARLYGFEWYAFLAACKCTLGVESGTSFMDLEDEVLRDYLARSADGRPVTADELEHGPLRAWEGNVPYRTIATRHFEAAAFRNCQILFEGAYSGVMEPMVHYLPLRKDFANFETVASMLANSDVRHEIAGNAHRDLIASRAYDVARLIDDVDRTLLDAGLRPRPDRSPALDAFVGQRRRRQHLVREMRFEAALLGAQVYRRTPEPALRCARAAKRALARRAAAG